MLLTSWLSGLFRVRPLRRRMARPLRRQLYRLHTPQLIGQAELLEDRTLLSAVSFVNDTWNLVTDADSSNSVTAGDVVDASNDPGGPTGTFTLDDGTGTVGNAYGTVTTGAFTGFVTGANTINSAIGGTDASGTVNVVAGTYTENVVVNKQVALLGAQMGVDARAGRHPG